MSRSDVATLAATTTAGGIAGWALATPIAVIAGLAVGAGFGYAANRAGIRPAVAFAVFAGALVGALVGRSIVRVLCLPGTCVPMEIIAAILTGIGALIGVGLVAALVTRSFDEYHEAVAARRPPPTPGCKTEETDPDQT